MIGLRKVVHFNLYRRFYRLSRSIFTSKDGKIADPVKSGFIGVTGNPKRRKSSCVEPCARLRFMDVHCKIALITGGSTGIGLAIADSLLCGGLEKAYLGVRNFCQGKKAVDYLNKQHGEGKSDFVPLDVNNHKQFEDIFKEIMCRSGSLDILVNNAGILNDRQWELEIDTNFKSVYKGILLANQYMPKNKNKGGCVVNLSSILGFDAYPYIPVYQSTKHSVVGITKSFGDPARYKKNNVRIVAVCPGVTDTVLVSKAAAFHQLDEELGKKAYKALQSLPMQSSGACGRGCLHVVEYGPPGSLWVIENSKLELLKVPDRKTYQTKVLDL